MNQSERQLYLIDALLGEQPMGKGAFIPQGETERWNFLRSLFNIRMPKRASEKFIEIQNEFLQEEIRKKGITDISELEPIIDDIYLWKGDITTLKCGAIVNAANSELLGCFNPNHLCIDNTIHTYAGIQLRLECNDIMKAQGHSEPIGKAKITSAYNLPSKYIIHTVGPMIFNKVMKKDCDALESCYRSCLLLADEYDVNSIAFCCISTGEFKFPNNIAAELAVRSVKRYKQETGSKIKVIFNVFRENDNQIYKKLLEE